MRLAKTSVLATCFYAVLLLTGCGSTYQVYKENLRLLLSDETPSVMNWDSVAAAKFDLISVEVGDNAGTMALAFVEYGDLKFIGADNSFLIFRNGRIVRTEGLKSELLALTSAKPDPILSPAVPSQWSFVIFMANGQSARYTAKWQSIEERTLSVLGEAFKAVYVEENITNAGGTTFVNQYWFDANGTTLLKTRQHLTDNHAITVEFVSRINRLLKE